MTVRFFQGDSLKIMSKIPSDYYDLILYSPPYNVGIEYDEWSDRLSDKDYIDFLITTFNSCTRLVKKGGHIIIVMPLIVNLPPVKPYGIQMMNIIYNQSIVHSMQLQGMKPWDKEHGVSGGNGIGSIYNKPRFIDGYEMVIVYRKGNSNRNNLKGELPIPEFKKDMANIWHIKPDTNHRNDHPASFPYELAAKIIKWFTREDENVLDPFCGIGTTLLAANNMNRNVDGIDLSKKYIEIGKRRIQLSGSKKSLL